MKSADPDQSLTDLLELLTSDHKAGDVLILSDQQTIPAALRNPHVPPDWMDLAEVAANLDRLGSRHWSLVCVLDPDIATKSLTTLLARLRDIHALRLLHLDRCERWSFADSLALGFSQVSNPAARHDSVFTAFEFELRTYKQIPDWLNAKNWANPELWDKHSW